MDMKKMPYKILPIAAAREELRRRAALQTEKLSRSVARLTSCDEPCPEYDEEVRSEYISIDDLLFYQQCRAALERCLANKTAALRYKRHDDTVQTVCFKRISHSRVKIWGLDWSGKGA